MPTEAQKETWILTENIMLNNIILFQIPYDTLWVTPSEKNFPTCSCTVFFLTLVSLTDRTRNRANTILTEPQAVPAILIQSLISQFNFYISFFSFSFWPAVIFESE